MFTIKGCSLIRGVHYERFHCTVDNNQLTIIMLVLQFNGIFE